MNKPPDNEMELFVTMLRFCLEQQRAEFPCFITHTDSTLSTFNVTKTYNSGVHEVRALCYQQQKQNTRLLVALDFDISDEIREVLDAPSAVFIFDIADVPSVGMLGHDNGEVADEILWDRPEIKEAAETLIAQMTTWRDQKYPQDQWEEPTV